MYDYVAVLQQMGHVVPRDAKRAIVPWANGFDIQCRRYYGVANDASQMLPSWGT